MIVIVCLDDKGGMMFNHRRQSRDKSLCAQILRLTKHSILHMKASGRDRKFRSLPSSFCFADQVRSRYRKVIACARETTASGLNVVALVLAVIWLLAAQMTALE